jgi:hypothetical protein
MKNDETSAFKSKVFQKFREYLINEKTGVLMDIPRMEFTVEFLQELENYLITTGNLVKCGMSELTPSDKFVLMVLDKAF